jgi:hypothetical protein
MFICRACCNDQFETDNERKEHEKLCSLKISPSKCWRCTYCLKEFASYAHASAVLHSSRCYLNLDAQKTSAAIRKATLATEVLPMPKDLKVKGLELVAMLHIVIAQLILCCALFVSAGVKRILDVSIFIAVNLNPKIDAIILSGPSN